MDSLQNRREIAHLVIVKTHIIHHAFLQPWDKAPKEPVILFSVCPFVCEAVCWKPLQKQFCWKRKRKIQKGLAIWMCSWMNKCYLQKGSEQTLNALIGGHKELNNRGWISVFSLFILYKQQQCEEECDLKIVSECSEYEVK